MRGQREREREREIEREREREREWRKDRINNETGGNCIGKYCNL